MPTQRTDYSGIRIDSILQNLFEPKPQKLKLCQHFDLAIITIFVNKVPILLSSPKRKCLVTLLTKINVIPVRLCRISNIDKLLNKFAAQKLFVNFFLQWQKIKLSFN
jgi:hypothetical protein